MDNGPQGVLCFLFTDVEGSSTLWARRPDAMDAATDRLDQIVRDSVEPYGGGVVKDRGEGDSHFIVFEHPSRSVHAASDLVTAVDAEDWPAKLELRVRVGIHVGEVARHDRDFYGLAVNQTTRIRSLGHGGQILASRILVEMSEHLLDDGLEFRSLGTHRVRDFARRQEIFQLCGRQLTPRFPPLNAKDLSPAPLAAIAMIDIVASSDIAASGHEAVVRSAQKWQDTVSKTADTYHGSHAKVTGDGCIATFQTPQDAVGFASVVRDRLNAHEHQIRAGVHFGPVDIVGDDITGRSIYLAAELVRLALPGQILISPVASGLLEAVGVPIRPAGTYDIPKHDVTWEASEA